MNRRDFLHTCTSGAVAAPLAAGMIYPFVKHEANAQHAIETACERVLRTGIIRCAYFLYEPNLMRDPATGQFSGIFVDLMNEIGRLQKLKIEWTEEGGVTTMLESLRLGRVDAIGAGAWPNALRAQHAEFSEPVVYNTLGIYARANDKRFDSVQALNDPSVRFAVIDGEMADQVSSTDFPKAKKVSLPALSDFSQLLLMVANDKADVTIAATHEAAAFEAHNPDFSFRRLDTSHPIRTFPNVLFFKKGEFELASMMNGAIDEVYYSGHLDQIISKYEKYPHSFIRVEKLH